MNFSSLLSQIKKDYSIQGIFYTSEFFEIDGEKKLYHFLKSLHRDRFEHDERIVIVQDCDDEYEYPDLPGKFISCLQQSAAKIDISNFFFLVVTANKKIDVELEQSRKLYSTDQLPIQHRLIQGKYHKKNKTSRDTFCVLPWMHLYIGPNGDMLPCCQGNQKFPIGNVNDSSIDSIIKSQQYNAIRSNMLKGVQVKECSRCWMLEDLGLPSARSEHNRRWKHLNIPTNKDGIIAQFTPAYLDIRLSNICNLKCRICSDYYSSAIAEENRQLYRKNIKVSNRSERRTTIEEILKYLPSGEKIYFAGGEPLLSVEHYEILNKLIECKNTDIEIVYNTNFSTLTFKKHDVLSLWQRFSKIKICASLDAMGNVAEYVRHGTVWQQIEENFQRVKRECAVDFTVTSTVGLMNAANLLDFQKNWHGRGLLHISKFSIVTMISPDFLTLQVLPSHHKEALSKKIIDHVKWCQENNALSLAEQWEHAVKYMFERDSSHLVEEFRKHTNILDKFRNESFKLTFPEYQDLI